MGTLAADAGLADPESVHAVADFLERLVHRVGTNQVQLIGGDFVQPYVRGLFDGLGEGQGIEDRVVHRGALRRLAEQQADALQVVRLHGHDRHAGSQQVLAHGLGGAFERLLHRLVNLHLQHQVQPAAQVQPQGDLLPRRHGQHQAGNNHDADNGDSDQ